MELSSSPSLRVIRQLEAYVAQYRLWEWEATDQWGVVVSVVWCLGEPTSGRVCDAGQWGELAEGVWATMMFPRQFVVASRDKEAVEAAGRRSAVLAMAMELSVAVKGSGRKVEAVMERWGGQVVEEHRRYLEKADQRGLSAVRRVKYFLMGYGRGRAGAEEWKERVRRWWMELSKKHGLDEQEAAEFIESAYDLLVQQGVEKGRREGLAEGLAMGLERGRRQGLEQGRRQGVEQGRLAALRESVLEVVAERFGEVPESVRAAVGEVFDLDELRALLTKALKVDRLEDMLPRR